MDYISRCCMGLKCCVRLDCSEHAFGRNLPTVYSVVCVCVHVPYDCTLSGKHPMPVFVRVYLSDEFCRC